RPPSASGLDADGGRERDGDRAARESGGGRKIPRRGTPADPGERQHASRGNGGAVAGGSESRTEDPGGAHGPRAGNRGTAHAGDGGRGTEGIPGSRSRRVPGSGDGGDPRRAGSFPRAGRSGDPGGLPDRGAGRAGAGGRFSGIQS